MYSYTSLHTLSLLGSLIASIDAYPTPSYLGPSSADALPLSPPRHQQPHTLYTSTSTSFHPSRSGTLTVHPPNLHSPSNNSPPLSLPFSLTSTCPHLIPTWSRLTSNLLTNILLLYPAGPTSSPYYTISPPSSSSPHTTYSITTTIALPTQSKSSEFRSTLHLTLTPTTASRTTDRIHKPEWRSLIALLHGANDAILRAASPSTGFGRWEIAGDLPGARKSSRGGRRRGEEEAREAQMEQATFGPSDVVFPSSSASSSSSSSPSPRARGSSRRQGNNPSSFTPSSATSAREEDAVLFTWKATWVYYGVEIDGDGNEVLRECSQMPLGVEIDFGGRGESEIERRTYGEGGEGKGHGGKEGEDEDEDEDARWKIDL
ncbi:hypothetical protein DSL72_001377 [Monilinia vaccinii-corymbosi]|uniref:Uncharacterized protein n=1 Tax=Monilinia vaccinii-corymbosi TaxID=61207 RepID=A0A8A3P990_9HELO|nr:hypothetical protein DSL72_001377 [Monilinia vaccinii-corymbosi]